MSDQPLRLPTWAAAAGLSASLRAEPVSSTASDGYAPAAIPAVFEWNWMFYDIGLWTRYFHERTVRTTDIFDASIATVYRVSEDPLSYTVAGPLAQSAATGATYYWQGDRLVIPQGGAAQTFAAASTNYVHLRTQSSETSRDPATEVLVSTNSSETGYATVLEVTTDATTVTAQTDLTTDGPETFSPWTFKDRIAINQTNSSAQEALRVEYPTSISTPGVQILAKAGAARTGLTVDTTAGTGTAIRAVADSTQPAVFAEHSGSGAGLQVENSGSGAGVNVINTTSSADSIAVSQNTAGTGVRITSTGGASALTIAPLSLDPTSPIEGDVWLFDTGAAAALRYYETGKTRIAYASQDGPNAVQALSTGTVTVNSATTTPLQTVNYTFRNGGIYMIRWATLAGRDAGGARTLTLSCRINAGVVTGGSFFVDLPTGSAFVGGTVNRLGHDLLYTHGVGDATYAVDLQVASNAGAGNLYFTNRTIDIICVSS